MHLDVHLENGQRLYFDPDNVAERLEKARQTTLLPFLGSVDQFARSLTYDEVPSYITRTTSKGMYLTEVDEEVLWKVFREFSRTPYCLYRAEFIPCTRIMANAIFCGCYFTLSEAPFTILRTFDEVDYTTYRAACVAHHHLDGEQN